METPSVIWTSRDIVLRKACPPSAFVFFQKCNISRFCFAQYDAVHPVLSQQHNSLKHLVFATATEIDNPQSLLQYEFSSLISLELYGESPRTLGAILQRTQSLVSIAFRHKNYDPFLSSNSGAHFEPSVLEGILKQKKLKSLSTSLPLPYDFLEKLISSFQLEYLCVPDITYDTVSLLSKKENFQHLKHLHLKCHEAISWGANNNDLKGITAIHPLCLEKLEYSCFMGDLFPNLLCSTSETLRELVLSFRYFEKDDLDGKLPTLPNLKVLTLKKVGTPVLIQQLLSACHNGALEELSIEMQDALELEFPNVKSSIVLPKIKSVYIDRDDCDANIIYYVLSSCYIPSLRHLDLVGYSNLTGEHELLLTNILRNCKDLVRFEGNYRIFRCLPSHILPQLTHINCYHDFENEEENNQYPAFDETDVNIFSQCTSVRKLEFQNELVNSMPSNWFSIVISSMKDLSKLVFDFSCDCHVDVIARPSPSLKTLFGSFHFYSKDELAYLIQCLPSLENLGINSSIEIDYLFHIIPLLNARYFKRLNFKLKSYSRGMRVVPYLKRSQLDVEISFDESVSLEEMVLVCLSIGCEAVQFSILSCSYTMPISSCDMIPYVLNALEYIVAAAKGGTPKLMTKGRKLSHQHENPMNYFATLLDFSSWV
jgi:hypothetical protein